jgi:hypothetical protein
MTDKITMDRKYTTRSGEPFELITTNGREPFPVLGYRGTDSEVTHLSATGKYYLEWAREDDRDLIPVPVKRQGWVNLYKISGGGVEARRTVWENYDQARHAFPDAIATVPIEWEEWAMNPTDYLDATAEALTELAEQTELAQAQGAAEAAVRWLSRDLACPANEHVINDACQVARRTVERYWDSGHDPVELGVQAGKMYVERNGVKV